MKVEQRIGRIDRYGQTSQRIRVYSLILAGTVEERILGRLYNRIGVFYESIGELEPILGEIIERLTHDLFTRELSSQQEEDMAEQTLISIEEQKAYQQQLDQFEDQLIGADIILGQERDGRIETGRYLGEGELRAVLESGLTGYSYTLTDKGSGYFFLRSTSVLRDDVATLCERERVPHEVRQRLLASLDEGGIPLTFKGELAHDRDLSHLVNFDHPLIRFAAARIPERETSEQNLAIVRLESADWPPGTYPFFIYQLSIVAAESRLELAAVVLDQHSGEAHTELAEHLLTDLWHTQEWDQSLPNAIIANWEIYEDYANDAFMLQRNAAEHSIKERNDRLVNIRQAALRRTHEVKRRRLEQWLHEATDAGIQRMRQAQISNADAEIASRLAEQEQLRNVVVSSSLRLQGILGVRPTPT